jgi:DNA replication protein DnaC
MLEKRKMIPRKVQVAVTTKTSFAERVLKKLPHLPYAFVEGMKRRNALKGKVMVVPHITPAKTKEFKCKQSRYAHVPELPMRAVTYGPSGSGKTILLVQLILDVYRDAFERIYIWSPSIDLDHAWDPVKKYVKQNLKVDTKKEKCFFNTYDPTELREVMDRQAKIAEYQKNNGKNGSRCFGVLIIVDDMADEPRFTRQSKLLHELYIRSRHSFISTITSVQKATTLHPLIRTQATATFTFRLRSMQDLDTWLCENSAVHDKKTLMKIYQAATDPRFGFLYMNLMTHDPRDMFFF